MIKTLRRLGRLPQVLQVFIVGLAQVSLDHPTLQEARNPVQSHLYCGAHLRPFPCLGVPVLDVATGIEKPVARDYFPSVHIRRRHLDRHRDVVVLPQEPYLAL